MPHRRFIVSSPALIQEWIFDL